MWCSCSHLLNSAKMYDLAIVFELSKTVITGQRFDTVLHTAADFLDPELRVWKGQVWGDFTTLIAASTAGPNDAPQIGSAGSIPVYKGSLEQLLQITFSRFQRRVFDEGCFVLRAEFGQDWFTPILQHPHCILRHPPTHLNRKTVPSQDAEANPITDQFVLFYLGPNVREFCAAFHSVSIIPGVNSW